METWSDEEDEAAAGLELSGIEAAASQLRSAVCWWLVLKAYPEIACLQDAKGIAYAVHNRAGER